MKKNKVFILTEGGEGIGFGHITRCSALYEEIEKYNLEVEFLVFGKGIEGILEGKSYKNVDWKDINYLSKKISKEDYIIIDSYLTELEVYNWLSENTKKMLIIDDNMRLDYPKSIVVNPSLYGSELEYPKNKNIEYLLGKDYMILRKEFNEVSKHKRKEKIEKILITVGGTDLNNLTPKLLKYLKEIDENFEINVIISKNFHNLDEIKNTMTAKTKLIYNLCAKEMKKIMESSDFAITACGQTIQELLILRVPFLGVVTATNQKKNARILKKFDMYIIEDLNVEFLKEIKQSLKDKKDLKKIIDGSGKNKIVAELLEEKICNL
ncbi:MAG: UDP-2,4-diacetamido-2,4,6-trideoxy-beta-L-altropyranose hydrolase [Psychrilyobacter sp.]|uniref:UDP-2,4-diacetamido-2,4, 6-trideoxy-beta-L-altropyranose hydrolase n=1 Tax=Psychrilyobacter sp. TaxID=2586924 RepID=UPI003C7333BC